MNIDNTAFFSTASTNYIIYSLTSLLTVRRWLPDAKLFILGTFATDYELQLMAENEVDFIKLDLTKSFYKTWDYPVERYYIFAGPQELLHRGFKYSVYLDGDVLCMKNPLIDRSITGIAGVSSPKNSENKSIDIFGQDWEKIKKEFKLKENDSNKNRLQSGVVYFNNEKMKKLGFLTKAIQVFKSSIEKNLPRKGDDSLFFLLQLLYFDDKDKRVLESVYNYIPQYHNTWAYPVADLVFFHFTIDKPWKKNPYFHKDKKLDVYNPYVKAWLKQFYYVTGEKIAINNESLKTELKLLKESRSWRLLEKIKKARFHNTHNKLQYKHLSSLKLSKEIRNINSKKEIKIWYWLGEDYYGKDRHLYNFGDVCIVDIIQVIFGYKIVRVPLKECELIGVGSIIQIAQRESEKNKIKVWGSGLIEKGDDNNFKNLDFYAVRGERTKSIIKKDVVLGDPGLLASVVYRAAKRKHNKIGVILHYADSNEDIAHRFRCDDRFVMIDPTDPPQKVAYEITRCRAIISSSLHGLIFSDSYKIPNAWLDISKNVYGDGYKFYDYFSGVKINKQKVEVDKIFDDKYQKELINNYQKIYKLRSIQKRLIKAFPSFN